MVWLWGIPEQAKVSEGQASPVSLGLQGFTGLCFCRLPSYLGIDLLKGFVSLCSVSLLPPIILKCELNHPPFYFPLSTSHAVYPPFHTVSLQPGLGIFIAFYFYFHNPIVVLVLLSQHILLKLLSENSQCSHIQYCRQNISHIEPPYCQASGWPFSVCVPYILNGQLAQD